MQATRTYLELTSPGQFRPAFGEFSDLVVERVQQPTPALYRHWYRTVGEPYHWDITLHVATRNGALAGWYELRRVPEDGSAEIAYFGLAPDAIGRGLGKHLLSAAVRDAWAMNPTRVWLHTCTLDHPHALPNYEKRGFVRYKTEEYEVT
ncbi:MAG: N-acetyltransferase [Gemmatimonadetes bacterium]|nr:MAG: N-acetyltransferase [Gemmatimonadota bacterium]